MATTLNRPVKRITDGRVFERGRRRVVVTLYPGDRIGMRLERTRREYVGNISTVFSFLAECDVLREQAKIRARVRELMKAGSTMRSAKAQARREMRQSS
jgi:hypothetical protein